MSEVIKRDPNHITVGAGLDNDTSADVVMLRVDAATNYLLADIAEHAATSASAQQIAQRDGNHKTVVMAWDATNEVLQEVLTDSNGRILCDLLIT